MQSSLVFKHSLRESSLELEKQCGSANAGHVITADASALREWSIRKETRAHHFDPANGKRKSMLLHYIRKYGVYLHLTCPKRRHSDDGNWAHKCVVQLFTPGLAPVKEIVLDCWPVFCAISPDERLLAIVDQDSKVVIYKLSMKKSYGAIDGQNRFEKTGAGLVNSGNYIPGVTVLSDTVKEIIEKPQLAPKTFALIEQQTLQMYGLEFSTSNQLIVGGLSFVNEFQFIVFSLDKVFIYGCEPSPLYELQQQSSVFTAQNQESLELSNADTGTSTTLDADTNTLSLSVDEAHDGAPDCLVSDPGNFSAAGNMQAGTTQRELPFSPSQVGSRAVSRGGSRSGSRVASRAPSFMVPGSSHGKGNTSKPVSRRASLRGIASSSATSVTSRTMNSSDYAYSESNYSSGGGGNGSDSDNESEFSDDISQLPEETTSSAKRRKKRLAKREKIAEEYFYWSNYDLVSMLDLAVYLPLKITFVCKISAESNKIFVSFNNGVIRLLSYDISMLGSPNRDGDRSQKPPLELFGFTAHLDNASVQEIVVCNALETKMSSSIYNIELLTSGDDGRLCHWGFQVSPCKQGEAMNQQLIHHLFAGGPAQQAHRHDEYASSGDKDDMSVGSTASSRLHLQTSVSATESWTVDLLGEQIVPIEYMYIDVAIPKEERTNNKKSRTVRVPMKQSMKNMQLFHAAFNPVETFQLCICTFGGMLLVYELNQTIHLLRGNMVESQQLTLANRDGVSDGVRKARIPENISRNMTWQSLTTYGTFGPASMFQDVSANDVLRVQQTLLLLQDDNSISMVSVESGEHLRSISVHLSGASGMDEVNPEKIKQKVIDTKLNHYHVHRDQAEDEVFPESSTATCLHWCDFSRTIIIGYANGNIGSVYFTRPLPNNPLGGLNKPPPHPNRPVEAAGMRSNGIGSATPPVGFPHCRKAHKSSIVFVSSYELVPAEFANEVLNATDHIDEDLPDFTGAKLHPAIGRNVYYVIGDKNGVISIWRTRAYDRMRSPSALPELMHYTSIHQGSILSLHTFNIPWVPIQQSHVTTAKEAGAEGNDFVYPRDKVLPFASAISAHMFKTKKLKQHHEYFLKMNHRKHHKEEQLSDEEEIEQSFSYESSTSASIRLKPVPPSAVLMMSSCASGLVCMWSVSLEGKMELTASFNANISDIHQPHLSAALSSSSLLCSTCLWPFVVLQTLHEVTPAPPPPVDYNKFTEDDEDDDCVFALDPRYAEMRKVEENNRRSESVLLTGKSQQVLSREKTKVSSSLHTITLCGYDNGEIRSYNIQNSAIAQSKPTVVPILSSILVSSSRITGIRMFCPDVSGTYSDDEGTFNNQYCKTLDNCAEVVTHFCDDGDVAANVRGLSCMAAVSSSNGVVWLVRVYGNGHIDCLHRFNVNLCPRSIAVAKDQYQHHRTASSIANNSSGGGSSAHLYITMSLLLREIMSVSNKLNDSHDDASGDGEAYNTNGSEAGNSDADMVSVEDEMSVGGTFRSVKKVCRTIEALAIHPSNVSKILLTVNQNRYQSLPLIWRNPPAPPPHHEPLPPPDFVAAASPLEPRSPVNVVLNDGDVDGEAVSAFPFASKDTGEDILESMADAEAVDFMGTGTITPQDDTGAESRPKTRELSLGGNEMEGTGPATVPVTPPPGSIPGSGIATPLGGDDGSLSARPSKRIDVNLATHLISASRDSADSQSLNSTTSASHRGGNQASDKRSVGVTATDRRMNASSPSASASAGTSAAAVGGHREAMMVELHRAKKDAALLAKFSQHSDSSSGTVSLQGAVDIVHSWLPQGNSSLGVVTEDMIWQLVELLHIDEAELLTFLDVAKIAAVVCSAIGFSIAPRQAQGKTSGNRARKPYRAMKTSVTKVRYNSMGERIVEKVQMPKSVSDGLPTAVCDELRKIWAQQEPRIVTVKEIRAAEPYSAASILPEVPKSFSKLINPKHVRIGPFWRGSAIGRSSVQKDWMEPNDNDGDYIPGGDDYWLSLRRTVRIARTIMNMRSTWQRTFLMQAKDNLPFSSLVLNPTGAGVAKVITMPEMVMKYFERYFGSSKLHVAHQKAMCFLEACVQYAEYPLLHYLATALDLIAMPNNYAVNPNTTNASINGILMINYLKDSHDRERIDKEQANWLYSELRDLLFGRNVVLLGDKVPAHDEADEFDYDDQRSSFSVSSTRNNLGPKTGLRTIIHDPTNNAQQGVHWMLLQRSDAILCADEMFRLRGRFGPRFIDAIIRQIYTLPAIKGEKVVVRSNMTHIAGAAVVNTIERDVGGELVDCEAYLELMIREFLNNQFKTESLYDDVYFRYLKINAVIATTKPHEINAIPRTSSMDSSRSVSSPGGAHAMSSKSVSDQLNIHRVNTTGSGMSGRDSPPLVMNSQISESAFIESETIMRNMLKESNPLSPPGQHKHGRQLSVASIPEEFKKDNLQISLNRIDNLFKHFIVFDNQRTGCIDMDKFEEVMHYHGPFVLGYPSESEMKTLIKLCKLNYRVPMDGSLCYLDFWAILMSWLMNSYGRDPFTVDIALESIRSINKGLEEDHTFALVQYLGFTQCMTTAGAFWMCKEVTQKHLLKLHKAHLHHCPSAMLSPSGATKVENEKVHLNIKSVLPAVGVWKPEETTVDESTSRRQHIQNVDDLVDELTGEGRVTIQQTPYPGEDPQYPLHSSASVGNIAFDLLKVKSVGDGVQNTYGAAERTLPVDGGEWRRQMTSGGAGGVLSEGTGHGVSPTKNNEGYTASVYKTERSLKTIFGETVRPVMRSHIKEPKGEGESESENRGKGGSDSEGEQENLDDLMHLGRVPGGGTGIGGSQRNSRGKDTTTQFMSKSKSQKFRGKEQGQFMMTDNTNSIVDAIDERPPLKLLDMTSAVNIPTIMEPSMKRTKKASKSAGQLETPASAAAENLARYEYEQAQQALLHEQQVLQQEQARAYALKHKEEHEWSEKLAHGQPELKLMQSESAPALGMLKRASSEIMSHTATPAGLVSRLKPMGGSISVAPSVDVDGGPSSSSSQFVPFSAGKPSVNSSGGFAGGFGRAGASTSSSGELKEDSLNNISSPSLSKYAPTVSEDSELQVDVSAAVGDFMSQLGMKFTPVHEPTDVGTDGIAKQSFSSMTPGAAKYSPMAPKSTAKSRSVFAKSYEGGLSGRTDSMIQALLTASDFVPVNERRLSISATSPVPDLTPKFSNPLSPHSTENSGFSPKGPERTGSVVRRRSNSNGSVAGINAPKTTEGTPNMSIKLDDDLSSTSDQEHHMHTDYPVHHTEFFFSPKNASASVLASYLYANPSTDGSVSATATNPMVPGGAMHQTHRAAALVEAEKRRLQTQIHENTVKERIFEEFELLVARRRAKLLALKLEREEMKRKERESMKKMHEADGERDKRKANYAEMERKIQELEEADKQAKEAAEAARVVAERERRNAAAEAKKRAEEAEAFARQERVLELREKALMEGEERTGVVIRKLLDLERKAVEAEKARRIAETMAEHAECKLMAIEEAIVRAIMFQEWEWKRKREDWKLMRANDINIKPEVVVEEVVAAEPEEEEVSESESENELEELERLQAAAAEAAAAEEGDMSHAQVMLNKFLKKVSDSDNGNNSHPRKVEAKEALEKKDHSLFFMPLDFGSDIAYQPFVDEVNQVPKKPMSPPVPTTGPSTAPMSRSMSRQQRTTDSPTHRTASPIKTPLPDNENTRTLPILDDDAPSQPDTDFSFITNSVTGYKKQVEKDRASQLYQTSNSEVGPDDWTRLVLKSSVNWTKYFEMDRASRLQLKLAEHVETEEEKKLRLERCFLEELSIQNDDEIDTLIDSTGVGSPKRSGSPTNIAPAAVGMGSVSTNYLQQQQESQDSTSYNEMYHTQGGIAAKTISIETGVVGIGGGSPPGNNNNMLSSSISASTNKKSVMSKLPPSLVAEMKQLMIVGTKRGEFKPLPFGHIEKAVIKARAYRYYQVEVLNNEDSIVTIELKCLFGDAEIYVLTDNNRHNDLSHIQSLGVNSQGVTAGTGGDASFINPPRNSMLLPSATRYDYMGKTANSDNKTVRLAIYPQRRLSTGVHAQNQLNKDLPKASMKTILISVYSATSGAMFTIWSFASADPAPQESMVRVSKYTRTFDVLSGHYTTEEMSNNLPRVMHNAKMTVEREEQERLSMEQMNNIFTMVEQDQEAADTSEAQGQGRRQGQGLLAHMLEGEERNSRSRSASSEVIGANRVRGASSVSVASVGNGSLISLSGSARRGRDDDSLSVASLTPSMEEAIATSAIRSPVNSKLASAMQGLFNTKHAEVSAISRSNSMELEDQYIGHTAKEKAAMELDEEDIFNLESHVAKAGRSIMRRELAENLNNVRTANMRTHIAHDFGLGVGGSTMDLSSGFGGESQSQSSSTVELAHSKSTPAAGFTTYGLDGIVDASGVGHYRVPGLEEQLKHETNPLLLARMHQHLPSISPRRAGSFDDSQDSLKRAHAKPKPVPVLWDPNNHPDLYMKLDVPSYKQLYNEVLPMRVVEEKERESMGASRTGTASREGRIVSGPGITLDQLDAANVTTDSGPGSIDPDSDSSRRPRRKAPFAVSASFSHMASGIFDEMEGPGSPGKGGDKPRSAFRTGGVVFNEGNANTNVDCGVNSGETPKAPDTPKTKEKKYLGKFAQKIMNINRFAKLNNELHQPQLGGISEKPKGSKIVLEALKDIKHKPKSADSAATTLKERLPKAKKKMVPVTYSLRHNQAAEISGKPLKPVMSRYNS